MSFFDPGRLPEPPSEPEYRPPAWAARLAPGRVDVPLFKSRGGPGEARFGVGFADGRKAILGRRAGDRAVAGHRGPGPTGPPAGGPV